MPVWAARVNAKWLGWGMRVVEGPQLLTLILTLDVAAYFAGLLFWYGYVMTDAHTPMWAWPFIPDCPFFGLLGGVGLLMVVARRRWSDAARSAGTTAVVGRGAGIGGNLAGYLSARGEQRLESSRARCLPCGVGSC